MKLTGKAASPFCADCGHERAAHMEDSWLTPSCTADDCKCKKFKRPSSVFQSAYQDRIHERGVIRPAVAKKARNP